MSGLDSVIMPLATPPPLPETAKDLEEIFKSYRALISYEKKMVDAFELCLKPPQISVGSTPSEVVWEEGGIRLLHYLPFVDKPELKKTPLLFIYALINKPYILDLQPDRSVVRQFLRAGFDCYLIDWGSPEELDKYRNTDDYVNYYIDSIVDHIRDTHNVPKINILGYCMGGTYSILYTALHPKKVRNLITMAAGVEWDDDGMLKIWSGKENYPLDRIVDTYGNVPGEFLNFAFMLLSPVGNTYTKYIDFVEKVEDDMFIANFFRMEKWIRDGIPLCGEAYREFIRNAYHNNALVKGEWVVGERAPQLESIDMPVLCLIGDKDTLVPPEESYALVERVSSKDKDCICYRTGHIGLSVGSKPHRDVWPKAVEWLAKRSGPKDYKPAPGEIKPFKRPVPGAPPAKPAAAPAAPAAAKPAPEPKASPMPATPAPVKAPTQVIAPAQAKAPEPSPASAKKPVQRKKSSAKRSDVSKNPSPVTPPPIAVKTVTKKRKK